jgi:hypothetical protein
MKHNLTLSIPRGFSRSTLGNPEGFYFILELQKLNSHSSKFLMTT